MMTSSNGNIFPVTGNLCGEFTGLRAGAHRPVMRRFEVFFDLRLNIRLSKQPWGWWFETLSCPLWRQCNALHWRWRHTNVMVSQITSKSTVCSTKHSKIMCLFDGTFCTSVHITYLCTCRSWGPWWVSRCVVFGKSLADTMTPDEAGLWIPNFCPVYIGLETKLGRVQNLPVLFTSCANFTCHRLYFVLQACSVQVGLWRYDKFRTIGFQAPPTVDKIPIRYSNIMWHWK